MNEDWLRVHDVKSKRDIYANSPQQPQTHQTPMAGCAVFWWTQSCIAQIGIFYMGLGVTLPSTP